MHDVVGDAELGIIALDKTLDIVVELPGKYGLKLTIPSSVLAKRELVGRLRDHYVHIDDRALGKAKEGVDPEQAWQSQSLVVDRKFTEGSESLDIDEEATELCIAARDYLVAAWAELVARGRCDAEGGSAESAQQS